MENHITVTTGWGDYSVSTEGSIDHERLDERNPNL
jgi:hypothetical protein